MKQTLFVVFDTETSCQAFPVYDMAWRIVDRQGREYNRGSYFMPDIIERITPIFRKHEEYPEYVAKGHVEQRFYQDVKDTFNRQVKTLREKGHRILLVAYNADFDRKALKRTAELMGGSRRSRFFRSSRSGLTSGSIGRRARRSTTLPSALPKTVTGSLA